MDGIGIIEMATSIKAIYRFNTVPMKISMVFLTEIGKKKSWNSYESTKDPDCMEWSSAARVHWRRHNTWSQTTPQSHSDRGERGGGRKEERKSDI